MESVAERRASRSEGDRDSGVGRSGARWGCGIGSVTAATVTSKPRAIYENRGRAVARSWLGQLTSVPGFTSLLSGFARCNETVDGMSLATNCVARRKLDLQIK